LLSQEKVSKKKATPYRLFLALLALMGGKRKLAKKWLKQPLAENSHQSCATQRGSRGEMRIETVVIS
jgi:hypothetical protein